MQHGEFFGLETLNKEYKDISFQHIAIPYTEEEIEEYMKTFKWDFNHLIKRSVKKYIKLYLPKYISAFFDGKSEHQGNAELYFGIADDGMVTGIPFQGEIRAEDFFDTIKELKLKIKSDHPDFCYMDNIQVEVLPVTYQQTDLPEKYPCLEEYIKKKKVLSRRLNAHNRRYKLWKLQNDLYSRKLLELYNDSYTRRQFIRYLRLKGKKYMVEMVMNGYQIEQKSFEEIRDFRLSGEENIYYWLCQWKDDMMEEIRKKKPLREKAFRNILLHSETIYGPMHFFIKARNVIPWWMQHNQNMNLYVIRFTFQKPSSPLSVTYTDSSGKEYRCYRMINAEKQPCCMPY